MQRLRIGLWHCVVLALLATPQARAADRAICPLECGAQFTEHDLNPLGVRTCLIRCAARAAAMGSANVTAATVMAMPQTPWTAPPGSGRGNTLRAPQPAAQRAREEREAARPRRTAPPGSGMAAEAPASPTPQPVAARGTADAGQGPFGAIHLAPAPSRNYGLVVGAADRVTAHRAAETACIGTAGATCRTAADFTDRCAAVAHALRPKGALVTTGHASMFTVVGASIGTGPTREEAERQAASTCAGIGRGGRCRITETRCAG